MKSFSMPHRLFLAVTAVMAFSLMYSCHDDLSDQEAADYMEIPEMNAVADTAGNTGPDSIVFTSVEDAERYMNESEYAESYRDGILPGMASQSLDYLNMLINSGYDHFIIVDKGDMKLRVYDSYGRMEQEYGMACAKNYGTKHHKGDSRTPEGFFAVEGVYDSTDWLYTDDNGYTSPTPGQYGPRFIRLKIPGTSQIGIHGTCKPRSIGHRKSHGCIRVKNDDIIKVVEIVRKGMPVIVVPGSRDQDVNLREGYDIPYVGSGKSSVTNRTVDLSSEN